jgi:hypothetical protein
MSKSDHISRATDFCNENKIIILRCIDFLIFLPISIIALNEFFSRIFLIYLNMPAGIILWFSMIFLTLVLESYLHNLFGFNIINDNKTSEEENSPKEANDGKKRNVGKITKNKIMHRFAILFHRNSFVTLWRILLIFFVFLTLSFYNPPPYLIIDPTSIINENASIESKINDTIVLKDLGSKLDDINVDHSEFSYRNQENWLDVNYQFKELDTGIPKYILVILNAKNLNEGRYTGMIHINASRKAKAKFFGTLIEKNIDKYIPVTLNVKIDSC